MKKILALALSGLMVASLYDPAQAQHRVPHAAHNKNYNKYRRNSGDNSGAIAAIAIMGALLAGSAIANAQRERDVVYYDDYGRPMRRPAPRAQYYEPDDDYRSSYREPPRARQRHIERQHQRNTAPQFDAPQFQNRDRSAYDAPPWRSYSGEQPPRQMEAP